MFVVWTGNSRKDYCLFCFIFALGMRSKKLKHINLLQLKRDFGNASVWNIGDGFFIADAVVDGKNIPFINYPTKIDVYVGLFCVSGNLKLSLDLKELKITRNTFSVITPGNIVKLENNSKNAGCHLIAIVLSAEYFAKLRFDISRFFVQNNPLLTPTITLTKSEMALATKYYSLMKNVISAKRPYMLESIITLCTSLIYEIAGAWKGRNKADETNKEGVTTRHKEIYDKFIALVAKHHKKESSVNFYAGALCISPKYLAKVVKSASGKTASYWIDSYIILEAQNLLRYSDLTIKDIVYHLNFSNQSVFYKFFKAHTGVTPTQYRNR